MEEDSLHRNLQKNQDEVLECLGRLQGVCPIYIPDTTIFSEKYVQHAHKATLHGGGMGLTMAKVREHYWILRLRRLVKVIRQCCLQPHPQVYCR